VQPIAGAQPEDIIHKPVKVVPVRVDVRMPPSSQPAEPEVAPVSSNITAKPAEV